MKKISYTMVLVSCAVILGGCIASSHGRSFLGLLPAYNGPKAHIAVADFEIVAAKATTEMAAGLREMLITALEDSDRFVVIQRPSSEYGKVSPQGGQQPDLIITASLVEFEPQASGGRSGIGGGGSSSNGTMGGLLGTYLSKAHLSLDIRIVRTSSSEDHLASTRIKGQATDANLAGNDSLESLSLNKSLTIYAHNPMDKAIRLCILETVRYISRSIPQSYYKYR